MDEILESIDFHLMRMECKQEAAVERGVDNTVLQYLDVEKRFLKGLRKRIERFK